MAEMGDIGMNQRGFISLPLTGYLWIAAGILAALLWLQTERLDAAQQIAETLEQRVNQWRGAAKECSEATKKASEDAQKRSTAAHVALSKAQAGQVASIREADRLRALVGQKPVTECPAGEAAIKVREGLK